MRLHSYRVLRPLRVSGRIAGVNEIVKLPEHSAQEYVDLGYLREIVNGHGVNDWAMPVTRRHP